MKKQSYIRFIAYALILILINIIGSFKFGRFDLTAEKRHTLSDATKNIAAGLDDIVYVRVYLEGDFPAGFKRLRNATKEMLDEFYHYSNGNLEYEFINPSKSPDEKTRNKTYQELIQAGLIPTNLQLQQKGGSAQKIIFPGAIFSYREKEMPMQLLKSQMGAPPEVMLNNSIQGLEYEIANTIRKISSYNQPKIAFIEGHKELNEKEVEDIRKSLSGYYRVERVRLDGKLSSLKGYKAIVIANPRGSFDDKDKFIVDQFIMRGGKVLWLIDGVSANMDSLTNSSSTMGIPNEINMDDLLFRYGVRINKDLIQDVQAAFIPVNTAPAGLQPKWDLFPWIYFPLIMPSINHPIVNNLNAIKCEFVSSLDTVSAPGVKKTILLRTSKYSRLLNTPVKIGLQSIRNLPDEELFNRQFVPVAVLMEGEFTSVFKNRIPASIAHDKNIDFLDKSTATSMIFVSDGDIIRNHVQRSTGKVYPLGIDKYTGQEFGNKDFILNCLDYLLDDSDLISVRSRELKLRLLDKTRIENERVVLQLANTCLPLLLVIVSGLIISFIRKRKYGN